MKKTLKKVKVKAGRMVDRLLPSSRPLSPAPADPSPSPVPSNLSPLGKQVESRPSVQTATNEAAVLQQPVQTVGAPSSTLQGHHKIPPAPSTGRHEYADPNESPTSAATAGSVIKEFLEAARDGSDLCLPLKAALVGVVKIWDICERTADVKDRYNDLESRLAHLRAVTETLSKRGPLNPSLKQRLENIAQSFERLTSCVEAKIERGMARRVLESRADIDEVNKIMAKISMRIEAFIYESMVRVEIGVDDILSRLPTAEEKKLEKELANWKDIVNTISSALNSRRVYDAAHDTQPDGTGCMPGTRIGVLSKFVEWVKNDPKAIFWLAGMAGTGKTSVALTLCRMLEEDPDVLLAGAFFCSRTTNAEARTDVRRILPTLAASLANQSPKFATALAAELKPGAESAVHKQISGQIGPLLQTPLAQLTTETRPIVFIIDALDECSKENELADLLKAIASFTSPAKVKFILTSRPETHILGSPIADQVHNDILQLHTINKEEVTEDIRLYVSNTFMNSPLAKPWYSDADVKTLSALSDGLFIFASTIISYILEAESVNTRAKRLQTALSAVQHSIVAMGSLDAMYEFVLTRASDANRVETEELQTTLKVLACVITARTPLSVSALGDLLSLDLEDLRESLKRLHAVVYVPEDDDQPGLRTLHASFGDYLFERAADRLRISTSQGNETLARGCLLVMRKQLHFNVSNIESSYDPNPTKRPSRIPHSLEYACMQWVYHVAGLDDPSMLETEIDKTFRLRLLFWLEVMSVLNRVWRAAAMLLFASSTVQLVELSQFLGDAHTFVASSQEAIERSAAHIYLSALPFTPRDSLIYRTFIPLVTGLISADTFGIDRHGGRLVMTLRGHESPVKSVSYSPDGRLLASGSEDGTLRVWDMRSGEQMLTLLDGDASVSSVAFAFDGKSLAAGTSGGELYVWKVSTGRWTSRRRSGHSKGVTCVFFAPDGSYLAAAAEGAVFIYNAETVDQVHALERHEGTVFAVAFSPAGDLLASGSTDRTIRLWRTTTGEPIGQPLRGHRSTIRGVAFSPDGTKLASASFDNDVRLWEPSTGICIATLRGHSDSVRSVQFSPNGQVLASSGDDTILRLWTLREDLGETASIALGEHPTRIYSVTFSPDGRYIALASRNKAICIWNIGNGRTTIQPLTGHSKRVSSVVVSADGKFFVSGSEDCSLRIWNAHTGIPTLVPLLGHTKSVYSVAISPDGRLLASASGDWTVRLWDAQTGAHVGQPLDWHNGDVNTVAFSPDGMWLASGADDKIVYIWDVASRLPSNAGPFHCDVEVAAVVFSYDGRLIAAADLDGHIHIWKLDSGERVREPFQTAKYNGAVAFSPDSSYIASGGENGVGLVWNINTGEQILILEGHTEPINAITFSSNGQLIGTGSDDRTIRLWNALTGTQLASLRGHGAFLRSLVFTPDGRSIVSGSDDSTIRVWDVEAASSLSSNGIDSPIFAQRSIGLNGGWILGTAGELLLWVPADYRNYLQSSSCKMMIAERRIVVNEGSTLHHGDTWMACWRGTTSG